MHDFLIAKDIVRDLKGIIEERNIENVSEVDLEIGVVALAHDGLPEHEEDITIENLMFGLEGITKNTELQDVKFNVKKIEGPNWKITNIVVK